MPVLVRWICSRAECELDDESLGNPRQIAIDVLLRLNESPCSLRATKGRLLPFFSFEGTPVRVAGFGDASF